MQKRIPYKFVNFDSLYSLLKNGIKSVAMLRHKNLRTDIFWFLLHNGDVLKINSVVSTIEGWNELGSLVFELENNFDFLIEKINLTDSWKCISSIEKLVYEDTTVNIESGILIKNCSNEELVVVSSSYPNSIELLADFYPDDFQPECDLTDYELIEIIE